MEERISIPDAIRTFKALRSLGYDLNSSIADLVDNSITEKVGANQVDVLFHLNKDYEIILRVLDDGMGMNDAELEEAMRIGSKGDYVTGDLGKFGMGMKTASLSHCNILTIISKKVDSTLAAFSWNLGHVKNQKSWSLIKLEKEEIVQILSRENLKIKTSGTIVLWDDLFLINQEYNSFNNLKLAENYRFKKVFELKIYLRMVFHRFLDQANGKKNLKITVNGEKLEPWDPFCLSEKATIKVNLKPELKSLYLKNYEVPIEINSYILPNRESFSSEEAWKEAKGLLSWNDSQGYYIYRSSRLIRYGGWHGTMVKDEHIKYARTSIDVDPMMDEEFRITVNKTRVEFPELLFHHLKANVNPLVTNKAKNEYNKKPEKELVRNKIRNNPKIAGVSQNLLFENSIKTDFEDNDCGAHVKVSNPSGTWLSNKLNEFLKYGQEKDFEIISDKIEDGMLWKIVCDPDNRFKVIINSTHPFYINMYSKSPNKEVTAALDALLFSLAFAELYNRNNSNAQLFNTFKAVCSKALIRLTEENII
jgi:hypothetical protein